MGGAILGVWTNLFLLRRTRGPIDWIECLGLVVGTSSVLQILSTPFLESDQIVVKYSWAGGARLQTPVFSNTNFTGFPWRAGDPDTDFPTKKLAKVTKGERWALCGARAAAEESRSSGQ